MKVLVVCARRYNGHELWTALGVMQNRGHTFEVVSTNQIIMDEITFKPNKVERTLDDMEVQELEDTFDAMMVVSGNMADTEAYWTDERVLRLIRKMDELERPIAAICCSVPTIREVVRGIKVSYFPLIRSRQLLEAAGAIPQNVTVTVDGRIVTAENQMGTQIWANAFSNVMEGTPQEFELHDSGWRPKGRERKPIPVIVQQIERARQRNES